MKKYSFILTLFIFFVAPLFGYSWCFYKPNVKINKPIIQPNIDCLDISSSFGCDGNLNIIIKNKCNYSFLLEKEKNKIGISEGNSRLKVCKKFFKNCLEVKKGETESIVFIPKSFFSREVDIYSELDINTKIKIIGKNSYKIVSPSQFFLRKDELSKLEIFIYTVIYGVTFPIFLIRVFFKIGRKFRETSKIWKNIFIIFLEIICFIFFIFLQFYIYFLR